MMRRSELYVYYRKGICIVIGEHEEKVGKNGVIKDGKDINLKINHEDLPS